MVPRPRFRAMILGPIAIFVAIAAVFLQAKHYERHGELFAQKAVCRAAVSACSLSPAPPSCASAGEVVRDVFNLTPPSGFIFPDDVVSLAQELVSIPSPSGAEHGAGRYIAAWLTARGWDVGTPAVGGGRDPAGRFNVVALPPGVGDTTAVRVLLSTHFDTVPLSDREPRLTESRLYGRGSVDAKGLLASMLVAAQELVSKGDGSDDAAAAPVGLLFVCGEETDHAGMVAANDLGFRSDVVIVNGEPTTGKLCVGQKGMLKLQIEATGVACHSGYPELGSSAIEALLDVLAAIRGVDWPVDHETGAATTLNIGVLNGGSARVEPVLSTVRDIVSSVANVSVTVVTQNPPQYMYAPPRALAQLGTYTAAYNTDLSYFKRAGKKVLFGGGTIANAHVADEYIEIDELEAMPRQYAAIVRELVSELGIE